MNKNTLLLVFGALIIGLLFNSIFVVNEKQKAIVFQFGEQVRTDVPVGFHFKLPIIQEVKKYDSRIQTLDEQPDRILTVESKYLLVDTFIKYKISDIIHLAAESHVDKSIENALEFANTNILGTYSILEALRKYHKKNRRKSW